MALHEVCHRTIEAMASRLKRFLWKSDTGRVRLQPVQYFREEARGMIENFLKLLGPAPFQSRASRARHPETTKRFRAKAQRRKDRKGKPLRLCVLARDLFFQSREELA